MTNIILKYELLEDSIRFHFSKKKLWGHTKPSIEEIKITNITNVAGDKISSYTKTALLELVDNTKFSYDDFEIEYANLINLDNEENIYEYFLIQLGFPEILVHLHIHNTGSLGAKNLQLEYNFRFHDRRTFFGRRKGVFLISDNKVVSIISKNMFSICELIDLYKDNETLSDIQLINDFKNILESDEQNNIALSERSEEYFDNTRVIHASKFTLDIFSTAQGFDFNPKFVATEYKDGGIVEEHNLLTTVQEENFNHDILPKKKARSSYVLEDGTYLFLDTKVRKSLDLIANIKASNKDTRNDFLKNPKKYLNEYFSEEYGDEKSQSIADNLFVETDSYSDKVEDIGLWVPPILPWVNIKGQQWVPDEEAFGIIASGKTIPINSHKEIIELKQKIEEAQAKGKSSVEFKGARIPANNETLSILNKATPIIEAQKPVTKEEMESIFNEWETEGEPKGKQVLIVTENFNEVLYNKYAKEPRKTVDLKIPLNLQHNLYDYQTHGLQWLIESWESGASGSLLADDMGLGKTFQLLAFLSWVRQFEKKPALIVAPTSLLRNWEKESELHLEPPFLGNLIRLYGNELKSYKKTEYAGHKEYNIAQPILDVNELKNADWIVTSYETMRDYEMSLGRINFSVIIFDEMQKVKNPKSLVTKAAKALNGDFVIGLTGTPVENRLADLHTITDTLRPGFLGTLKEFSKEYEKGDVNNDKIAELKNKLENSHQDLPKTILRRLKKDVLDTGALKKKTIKSLHEVMPAEQAMEYNRVIREYKQDVDNKTMLEAIQRLRNVSLIIEDPRLTNKPNQELIANSARLKKTFEILDDIKAKNEKCIIFVESIKVQRLLKEYIDEKYSIIPDIINGSVPSKERQNMVDRFQIHDGKFNIIILSPKSAGTGFTITAANHVIHLSRWWNPAIEDQATDRAYRIGQEKEVHVYYPLAIHPEYKDESFDVKLDNLISKKRELSEQMLLPRDAPNNMSEMASVYKSTFGVSPQQTDYSDVLNKLNDTAEFDDFVISVFEDNGFKVEQTKASHDYGVDLIAEKGDIRYYIECKFTHNNEKICGDDFVDRMIAGYICYPFDGEKRLLGITNANDWSHTIKSKAQENNVKLYNKHNIHLASI